MDISRYLQVVDSNDKANNSLKRKHEEQQEGEKNPKTLQNKLSANDYFSTMKPKKLDENESKAIESYPMLVDSDSESVDENELIEKIKLIASAKEYSCVFKENNEVKTEYSGTVYIDENFQLVKDEMIFEIKNVAENLKAKEPEKLAKPISKKPLKTFTYTSYDNATLSAKPLVQPKFSAKPELLSDRYSPKALKDLIGNKTQIQKLLEWLKRWQKSEQTKKNTNSYDKLSARAVLISGPPGIGKTTTARIVSKDMGFQAVEFNASDTRNKQAIVDKVRPFCLNTSIKGPHSVGKGILIMDEVDGMSAGDEGGSVALIEIIKMTKIPIICICNDRHSSKIKSLAN